MTTPRCGEPLQARREVRRLTHHGLLLGGARADEVANDYEAGRDPDAHLQWDGGGCLELRHRLGEGKPCPDAALGVVFMRSRIAEIGEHAVARVLGDEPPVARCARPAPRSNGDR